MINSHFWNRGRKSKDMRDETMKDIERDLLESIQLYSNFVLDGKPTYHEGIGLHEETVISRAAIHDMLVYLQDHSMSIDVTRLRQIDAEWQSWIQANKDEGFRITGIIRDNEPKSNWWYWIDELDKLTKEERSTL